MTDVKSVAEVAAMEAELAALKSGKANQDPSLIQESAPLKTESILEFMKGKGYDTYSNVQQNMNDYPFMTFCNTKLENAELENARKENREANPSAGKENVYFSRAAFRDKHVQGGDLANLEFMKKWQIAYVKNANQEDRIKLALKGAGRHSIADLEAFEESLVG